MNDDVGANVQADSPRGIIASQSKQQEQTAAQPSAKEIRQAIVVCSTFTGDPLARPLAFWMDALDIAADIEISPYGQLMQSLLSSQSALSVNITGFNVLVIRLEDWVRDRPDESIERNLDHVRRVADDLLAAIKVLQSRTNAALFVFIGEVSTSATIGYVYPMEEIQQSLVTRLRTIPNLRCWTHADLIRLYPIERYEDRIADRVAHIPYTNDYFAVLATLLARNIAAQVKPRYKVIAVDCDNTLWKGVCGEDGAAGIELTPAHVKFQEMLVRQYEAGMLLCLCTKNNPADVEAVFATRHEMPLREEHLICSRVNWNSKSSNLQSLAHELDLSLDSFVFVDDSGMECAEVQAHCPSALTLRFPEQPEEIAHFIDHVWAFDRVEVTEEAKRRTVQYKENRARTAALGQATNLEQFLATLELQVDASMLQASQLPRVAELIQRTNQFNLTDIRRRAAEIEALWTSGDIHILVIHVRDRFGDYGLVGTVLFRRTSSSLDVDTFVLSCRALGRGVEQRILNELGRIALSEHLPTIVLKFRQTPRNKPAREFLESSFAQFSVQPPVVDEATTERVFVVPVEYALNVGIAMSTPSMKTIKERGHTTGSANTAPAPMTAARHDIGCRLSRLSDLVDAINRAKQPGARVVSDGVGTRTANEVAVGEIFADVLALEDTAVFGDFFELGGDSLQAVQVISRIASVLGIELSLHEFLDGSSAAEVAGKLAEASQISAPIRRVDRAGSLPLSWAQQRLWFIDQLERGSAAYHIPLAIRLSGELNRTALVRALNKLVARHEALRTTFVKVAGEPQQRIAEHQKFFLESYDLTGRSEEQRTTELRSEMRVESTQAFDLAKGPLIRGKLLQLLSTEYVLLITMHHIVSDGWSVGVLVRELCALYSAFHEGRPDQLPALPIQYADYAQWQREWLAGTAQLREQLGYWRTHLEGAPELLELPTDRVRPAVQSYRGASVHIDLGADLTAKLKSLSRQFNLTLAMTLFAAWSAMLSRISGQDDVVIGMPVANRRRTELEGLIGIFVNTLAVRVRVEDDPRVIDLLQRVKEVMLGAYANQDAPFEQVVEELQPVRTLSHSPIFQVMFVLQTASRGVIQLPGLSLVEQEVPLPTAQFDITLELQECGNKISGSFKYASDLFDAASIDRWAACFTSMLHGIVRDPQQNLSRLELVSDEERQRILRSFNATYAPFPEEKRIHQLFEEQVERTPYEVAVRCADDYLTYRQLNGRANQLAQYLRRQGVGPDRFVGLCVERSIDMVVGILGILKSGGAYVPVDPNYPQHRLEYVLNDAAPMIVLIHQHLSGRLPAGTTTLALDTRWNDIAQQIETNLDNVIPNENSANLAYAIYTSGSTGQPKGVGIEHRNAVNMICWAQSAMLPAVFEQTLFSTSLNFDLSVYECFVPLASGGSIRLVNNALSLVNEPPGVTLINTVPSAIKGVLDSGEIPSTTRVVNLAGEALKRELVERIFERSAARYVCNLYGPSETTTYSTWIAMAKEDGFNDSIGRPIANTQIYILDAHGQVVPVGITGEIYIGGAGVARGYLNQPELTAQRFVKDPFNSDPQARMYRTGDLGRWRTDGTIEYLGRNDHQIKIRGFRIELGEIETQLTRHEQVNEAVVIAREDVPGDKRLVGYVVAPDGERALSVEMLRTYLKGVLPEYMVPSALVMLDRMPLTPNGKLDRRALPAPELGAYVSREYEAPQGEMEEVLAGIWQSVLRVERVGRRDNFFELGGHSLLIMQMMERLRRVGLAAEVRRVFESPTLADLALALTDSSDEQVEIPPNNIPHDCQAITPEMLPLVELEAKHIELIAATVPGGIANIQDIYPLAPLQEGILFHHLLNEEGGDTYVLATLLSVSSPQRIDELVAALQSVIDRHDILRTAALWEQLPQPVQIVYRKASLPVHEITLDPTPDAAEQIKEWMKPERQRMDLRQAPLMRLTVARESGEGRCYALLQLHHLTIDHVTLEIVTAEVVAHLQGHRQVLPESTPYRNYVAQVVANSKKHDAEAFFKAKLADVDEPTAPFGFMNVHGDGRDVQEAHLAIDHNLAKTIRDEARRLGVSSATLFHAAWSLVVAGTSGRDDVVFGSVLLGRLHGHAADERMLGMFINTLPVRLRLDGLTAAALVEQTQRELVELLSHDQVSLATAQRCSAMTPSTPLFTALLNYRHSISSLEAQWSGADGVCMLAAKERTNYPVVISVDDMGFEFTLTAQTDHRIDPQRITSYLNHAIQSLVATLKQAPQTPALAISVMTDDERRQVLELFNATDASYPQEKLVQELFEDQVHRSPEAIAAVWGGEVVTYARLNARANQLARVFQVRGALPGDYIPLLMPRSLQMLVAQLAVLKCGGVYVPIDPDWPVDRHTFTIRDCAASLIVTNGDLHLEATLDDVEEVDCETLVAEIDRQSDRDLKLSLDSAAAAYVMYTSGSTGVPKGVIVSHRAVNRLAINNGYAQLSAADCIPHYSNPAFDASTFEIWGALLNGAKVVVVQQSVVLDTASFVRLLEDEKVTVLWMSVGLFNQYVDAMAAVLPKLRYLLVGGDSLDPQVISRVLSNGPPWQLLNAYGPTECTTFTTTFPIKSVEPGKALPIGRPISNAQVYILDSYRRIVPLGVAGELYIGGAGLAHGYLKRPELTAERFVANPFSTTSARLYKTGDLARWRPDGVLEFLGRNDFQVKIRGFRIELGEIEAQLTRHAQVKEAVVVVLADAPGEKRLVAYTVPADSAPPPSAEELRSYLKGALPEYMMPSAFVTLERLPLSPTGKVNRRALPKPEIGAYALQVYEAPQGEIEESIAQIWQNLLGVDRVGRSDDFFQLGGHSLLALKALLGINQLMLGSALKVADIYRGPTIKELGRLVRGDVVQDGLVDLFAEATLDSDITAIDGPREAVPNAVLLTGATGFVGRFLLAQILQETNATVYCLARAASQQQAMFRIRTTLARWDLWRDEYEPRIIAVQGDLRLPQLGIDQRMYQVLSERVDTIYHCATSMNHLETYAMAKAANVGSAREVLRLATLVRPKLINYISTLGVFSEPVSGETRVVSEASSIDHERHSNSSGYTASKWIGEKIFMTASERGIPCNIFRLGLIWADTQLGRYDELQREYRIIKSSLISGLAIQQYRYEMPPTPVDYAARAIVFLGNKQRQGSGIFHISSSRQLSEGIFELCNEIAGTSLELLPMYDWVAELKRLHLEGRSLPAVPLIEFAFSMTREEFREHRRRIDSPNVRIECARTHRELERAGIVAPVLNDEVLRTFVGSIFERDAELHELIECSEVAPVTRDNRLKLHG